jgi:hypothetical protein
MKQYKMDSLEENKSKTKMIVTTIIVILIVAAGIYVLRNKGANNGSSDIVDRVSKLYSITDKAKAKAVEVKEVSEEQKKGASIYKDVKPGDYFVQLDDTKRVIVYRPSENKILRVDPLIEQQLNNN